VAVVVAVAVAVAVAVITGSWDADSMPLLGGLPLRFLSPELPELAGSSCVGPLGVVSNWVAVWTVGGLEGPGITGVWWNGPT